MLLKIKPHSPEEKPSHSCEVIMAMSWGKPELMYYSQKYNAWNCRDTDDEETAKGLAIGTENMIGWVYSDEVYWQMVSARREDGDEIQ